MSRLFYLVLTLCVIAQSDILWCQSDPQKPDGRSGKELFDGRSPGGFCGTDHLRAGNASAARTMLEERINHILYQKLDRRGKEDRDARELAADAILTIPVVVHIVHNGGEENISDAQVLAGIQHMNEAFANIGVYDPSTGVSVDVQFCLAKQDPAGAATTGITRTPSPLTDLMMEMQDMDLKDLSRWDPESYLNIWLVREISSFSSGSGVAGYAYLPSAHGAPHDGIVGEAGLFGSSTDNSKVFVHEVGHYLGLYHTFQGGCANNDCLADGDRVCDTPPDATTAPIPCGTPFNSCTTDDDDLSPNNPFRPTGNGGIGDQGDLYIDYMDYGRLECYTVFTQGQKERMRAVLTEIRASLLASKGCMSPCTNPVSASFTASSLSVVSGTLVTFTNTSTGASSYEWSVEGTVIGTGLNASRTFYTQGSYPVVLKAFNGDPACADADTVIIRVTCPVRASFITDKRAVLPGGKVAFINTTSPGAASYEWRIDGALVSTLRDYQHTFDIRGGYHVTLVASNGRCRDTAVSIFITVGTCELTKEWNIWYFGENAGVDFNSGAPVATTSALAAQEGTASVCDVNGNLLFYSDGTTVWDRRHTPMPGGSGLQASSEWGSAQEAAIVPVPMSDSLYYLFTTSNWTDASTNLRYSIIDMSRNGGFGGVTPTRDVVLNGNVAEQVAAVGHANCRDIWIVSHERENNRFVAYLLTPTGLVTTPVVSAVGSVSTGSNRYGCLKFSHDGKRISSSLGGGSGTMPTLELFDFNTANGQVSNPMVIGDATSLAAVMSSEFSPDNRLLYTSNFASSSIYQFDLSAGSASAIRASRLTVADGGRPMSAFQMGPDGRIYIVSSYSSFLSVIQNPNALGSACGFVRDGVDLNGAPGGTGLPGRVERYARRSIAITGPQNICIADSVQTFTAASSGCFENIWRVVGNAEVVTVAGTTARVRMKDSGNVMLIVEKADDCGLLADTLRIRVGQIPRVDLGPDTALCSGGTVLLDAGPGGSYRWQDGSTGRTFLANGPGVYWVEVGGGSGCAARDTVRVLPNDAGITTNLGPDTSMCDGRILLLDAGAGALRYRWQDGSTERRFTAYRPGTYWVEVTGHCGTSVDTIVIAPGASALTLGGDTTVCGATTLLLDAGSGYVSYLWQDGSTGQTFLAPAAGTYWVEAVLASGCIARDTVQIIISPDVAPPIDLGRDTTICGVIDLVLDAGPGYSRYLWQDGSTGRTLRVSAPGTYRVRAWVGECEVVGSITIGNEGGGTGLTASLAEVPLAAVPPGTEITIPLRLTSLAGGSLYAGHRYNAIIRFNRTVLFPTGATPRGEVQGDQRVIPITGIVGTSDTLTLMTFVVLLGDSERAHVRIDSFSVEDGCAGEITRQDVIITIDVCEIDGQRLILQGDRAALAVRTEHPANKRAVIDYTLIEEGNTSLSLVDARGRQIQTILDEKGTPGDHHTEIDIAQLESGIYFVILTTSTEMLVEKFVVKR